MVTLDGLALGANIIRYAERCQECTGFLPAPQDSERGRVGHFCRNRPGSKSLGLKDLDLQSPRFKHDLLGH